MQTINYDAIKCNALYFKNSVNVSKLCAVIKNDAYGHGIERVADTLKNIADYFAVGSVAEANKVSRFGVDTLILLPLNARDTLRALKLGAILTLDSFDTLNVIERVCKRHNLIARVHIKIDSGMSRLGFFRNQLDLLCDKLSANKSVKVYGIYSHFWGESDFDCDKQLDYFNVCCDIVKSRLKMPLIRHIANTSATLLNNKYHLDMVRVGLGLYGYGCNALVPSKTVTCKVLSVKTVPAGSVVGYGGRDKLRNDTTVAVIDVGYANGFPRALYGATVKINDVDCVIIGNICMGMCMVDVSNVKTTVGDNAFLLGIGQNPSNCNVIVYELLCNLK